MYPRALWEGLASDGPDPAAADRLQLFGQFVGSWDLDFWERTPDGERRAAGEVHFGWALGGRAVQDVWIVPTRRAVLAGEPPLFWGTTVRMFDPRIGAWRSTWIEPVHARVRRFLGRESEGRIVLEGIGDTSGLRWSFNDITGTSFRWVGEVSEDGGRTWTVVEEMRATRRAG